MMTERAVKEPGAVRRLWADGFGTLATRCVQALVVLAVIVVVIFAIMQVSIVGIPVLLALIVSSAIVPFTAWLRRRGAPAMLAAWTALLSIVVTFGLLIWLIVWAVLNQWNVLVSSATGGMQTLQDFIDGLPFTVHTPALDEVGAWAQGVLASSGFQSGALAGVSATAEFFTGFGIFVVVLFFFLKDGAAIWEFLLRPLHGDGYARARRAGQQAVTTFGSYLRGTTIVAAADAVGIGIGLVILQVPLALPLAVIVFVTAYIPIVGATLAGGLAALVALVANGPVAALIVIAIVIVVNQLEGNLLQPVVMGRTLKLHPLVILIALTIGASLGGVLGAIIAVPLTAAAWSVLQVWDGPGRPARFARAKSARERREAREAELTAEEEAKAPTGAASADAAAASDKDADVSGGSDV
ncbi:AI-2E family transporter [Pseudoclavibacter sp. CFCC 11306]|nr:AI-2E family transporter [Pseudoclavibacter sp. CFCC 11306]